MNQTVLKCVVLCCLVTGVLLRTIKSTADDKADGRDLDIFSDMQITHKETKWGQRDKTKSCKDCKPNETNDVNKELIPRSTDSATRANDKDRRRHGSSKNPAVKPFLMLHQIRVRVNDKPQASIKTSNTETLTDSDRNNKIPPVKTTNSYTRINTVIDSTDTKLMPDKTVESSDTIRTGKNKISDNIDTAKTKPLVPELSESDHDDDFTFQDVDDASKVDLLPDTELAKSRETFKGTKYKSENVRTKQKKDKKVKLEIGKNLRLHGKPSEENDPVVNLKSATKLTEKPKNITVNKETETDKRTKPTVNVESEDTNTKQNSGTKEQNISNSEDKLKNRKFRKWASVRLDNGVQDDNNDTPDDEIDVVIPAKSDSRFVGKELSVLPDVERLEQRLHPVVDNPVDSIIESLERVFGLVRDIAAGIRLDHGYVFNSTRDYMTSVRTELTTLAHENDQVYGTIMDAALLTKRIYLRAHGRHRALHDRRIPVNFTLQELKVHNYAAVELNKAEGLRDRLGWYNSRYNEQADEFIRLQTFIETKLNTRAMDDLTRYARRTIDVVTQAQQSGVFARLRRFERLANPLLDLENAKRLIRDARNSIHQIKSTIQDVRVKVQQVKTDLASDQSGSAMDSPVDDTWMMIWAAQDEANYHTDKLISEAYMIKMKISPLLAEADRVMKVRINKATEVTLEATVHKLGEDSKLTAAMLDEIILLIGDERFLKERCEDLVYDGSGDGIVVDDDDTDVGAGDDDEDSASVKVNHSAIIDCSKYIDETIIEASGDFEPAIDEEHEGSGETEDIVVDLSDKLNNSTNYFINPDNNEDALFEVNIDDSSSEMDKDLIIIDDDIDKDVIFTKYGEDDKVIEKNIGEASETQKESAKEIKVDPYDVINKTDDKTDDSNASKGDIVNVEEAPLIIHPYDDIIDDKTDDSSESEGETVKIEDTGLVIDPVETSAVKPDTLDKSDSDNRVTTKKATPPPTTTSKSPVSTTTERKLSNETSWKVTTEIPTTAKLIERTIVVKTAVATTKPATETTLKPTPAVTAAATTPVKTPSSTTTAKPTAATKTETEGIFSGIRNWLGALQDAPAQISEETIPAILNEAIRQRMDDYSKGSQLLMDETLEIQSRQKDLSDGWSKAYGRYIDIENKTNVGLETVGPQFKAKLISFQAVSDRVTDVYKNVEFKSELVTERCNKSVASSQEMLTDILEKYATRQKQEVDKSDPQTVSEAVQAVTTVNTNIREIQRLTNVLPNGCKRLESYDRYIRENITVLRDKIAKAKLLASYLQVAANLGEGEKLGISLTPAVQSDSALTTNVEMKVKPGSDNVDLLTMYYNTTNTGYVSVSLRDKAPHITQVYGAKTTENETDMVALSNDWYSFHLHRLADSHLLTIYNSSNSPIANLSVNNLGFIVDDTFSPLPSPVYIEMGSDEGSVGCVSGLKVNGRNQRLFNITNRVKPSVACKSPWSTQSVLVLGGTGFLKYDLNMHPRITHIKLTFTANSDGNIFYLKNGSHRTSGNVSNGLVYVRIEGGKTVEIYRGNNTVYGIQQIIEIVWHPRSTLVISVRFNGQPVYTEDRDIITDYDRPSELAVFIGGSEQNPSSVIGCVQSLQINKDPVELSQFIEHLGDVAFGTCPKHTCARFGSNSTAITFENIPKSNNLHIAVNKQSNGRLLTYSRPDAVDFDMYFENGTIIMTEHIREETQRFTPTSDRDYIILTIVDDYDNDRFSVSVDGYKTEPFYYTKSWLFLVTVKPLSITIGGGDDDDRFHGDIQEIVFDGSKVPLDNYTASHNLEKCSGSSRPIRNTVTSTAVHPITGNITSTQKGQHTRQLCPA